MNLESQSPVAAPILFKIDEKKPVVESNLKSLNFYQQELKKILPEEIFERVPSQAFYLLGFLIVNFALIYFVSQTNPAWYFKLLAALAIGQFNAGLAFVAHDTLHGSVFKNKALQNIVGAIGFAPFLISTTYWRFWHNNLHHGNTQLIYKDPDAFPTLSVYKRSKFMRVVFDLSPGSKKFVSFFYFFYWFSFQSVLNQAYMRFRNKMWDKMDHKQVTLEFVPLLFLAAGYLYWVGATNFLWLVMIPVAVQNYVVLSYILTNHNISPLTKINDPLENSLTVTTNPVLDFLHLNFGYHVEHHLFPRVSSRHAKKIHAALRVSYPEKYKFMPKWKALKYLYQTPRLYKNSEELIHPKTLKTYPTI
ncbi:MAG: fatty acid desaturase [Bacteriovoracaceae bacterium]|nr:fatty acid desaturase [Bacteriovoracaceae bacterium]